MRCIECGCDIPEGEEQYTDDGVGPYCDECFDEVTADAMSLRFVA